MPPGEPHFVLDHGDVYDRNWKILIKDGGVRRDVLGSLSVFILTGKSVLQ